MKRGNKMRQYRIAYKPSVFSGIKYARVWGNNKKDAYTIALPIVNEIVAGGAYAVWVDAVWNARGDLHVFETWAGKPY